VTRDEATAAITAACPWLAPTDLDAFLAPETSDEERAAIVSAYRGAGVPAEGPSSWDTVLGVLKVCADVAGMVLPLIGVVQAVYGLAKGS